MPPRRASATVLVAADWVGGVVRPIPDANIADPAVVRIALVEKAMMLKPTARRTIPTWMSRSSPNRLQRRSDQSCLRQELAEAYAGED